MRKHSPVEKQKVLRKQGITILILISAIILCSLTIGGLILADYLSGAHDELQSESTSISLTTTYETLPTEISENTITSDSSTESSFGESTETTDPSSSSYVVPTLPIAVTGPDLTGYVVVLDPGHQQYPNREQEPLSPILSGSKDKVSAGTSGVYTGRPEYEVNLEIGLLLREYLETLGCAVYMTRIENNVDISNIERAEFALSYTPDAYIRLHCDGSSDPDRKGIGVFVADTGKYKTQLVGWADLLGQLLSDSTGANYRGCDASSRYSGLNWAVDIPAFLLEMGYMTNPTEDERLSQESYQLKICEGIAEFVSQMPINSDRPQDLD